jgi:hypothetical protein
MVTMKLNPVFERFVENGPITVMIGGTAERMLNSEQLNAWFEGQARGQAGPSAEIGGAGGLLDVGPQFLHSGFFAWHRRPGSLFHHPQAR